MITKCRFCDYQKQAELDPKLLLKVTKAFKDYIDEDVELFFNQLFEGKIMKDYHGVKIHMGRMHKGEAHYGIQPEHIFERDELVIIRLLDRVI